MKKRSLTLPVVPLAFLLGYASHAQPEEREVCMVSILESAVGPVVDAIAAADGYREEVEAADGSLTPNPETKLEFAERYVLRLYDRVLGRHLDRAAADADRESRPPVSLKPPRPPH